jgi:signal transduction histidine kinase
MSEARTRAPWIVWGLELVLILPTLVLSALNWNSSEDPVFTPVAVVMVLGYSTVGAVLASRNPSNSIGWLLMTVGVAFLISGFTSEYVEYAYVTSPGSLPAGSALALVSNSFWLPMLTAVILITLLFPTGAVPTRRWRHVPPAIVGLAGVAWVAGVLYPGRIDLDLEGVQLHNPIGVEALRPAIDLLTTIGWIGVLIAGTPLAVTALILRYRRSHGEERQQIRWLAYTAATVVALVVISFVTAALIGEQYGETALAEVQFLAVFIPIAIGVPAAIGVSVLKYRLYDLDLVVKKTVLYSVVAALLIVVFGAIAVVAIAVVGRTDTGAIVAAGALGLLFWPALRVARRVADRIVYGRRATPYEVLAAFSARVGGSYGDEDVLPRMAQILGDAVGARRATVWLRVGGALRPAASVPPDDDQPADVRLRGDELPDLGADAAVEVRDRGQLLGALAVTMAPNDPMTPSRERLVRDLAAQAGLVLRNVRLIEELRASRKRLVVAQDQRARKLERDIHDGAQQQLVALAVKLRLADSIVGHDDERAHALLGDLQAEANDALENLRDLARGIYPPLLADKGLAEALSAQARKSPVAVEVDADGVGRCGQDVEVALYFCILEAMSNMAKYAHASSGHVRLARHDGNVEFEVVDDGVGFDPANATSGSGLQGMADRLEAVGGTLTVDSTPGRGTTVSGIVPVGRPPPPAEGAFT